MPARAESSLPSFEQLEEYGARIGKVYVDRKNIFDTANKKESKRFYHWINRMHIMTREDLIRSQLLFSPDDPVKAKAITESERLLRQNKYLYSASITVESFASGVADLKVTTQDLWTLSPEFKLSRNSGKNYLTLGVEDDNFLGTGASLTLSKVETIDRTSSVFNYSNRNLFNSRLGFNLGATDSDDGGSFSLALDVPFYSLDTRRAAGFSFVDFESTETFYRNGAEAGDYFRNMHSFKIYKGWSTGRRGRWVKRLTTGLAGERSTFKRSLNPASDIGLPSDRQYYYPYLAVELLEDRFETTRNYRTIGQTEDVYLGSYYSLSMGFAAEAVGSNRDALLVSGKTSHHFGSAQTALWSLEFNASGRLESGTWRNQVTGTYVSYAHRFSDRWQFFSSLHLQHSERPDLDRLVTLGGASGLRGYPERYRNGRGRGVLKIEQRYYSNWYPLRLFRVGGAVFLDVGQVWGENALGETNDDLLSDAGIGLRLGSTKGGSKKVIHIDLAFPLKNYGDLDEVQLLVDVRQSF